MMDEIDKKILDELSKNSHLTMKKLGKKYISLHQQPCQD
ncbi:AsnC family transcriptional regulator [Neobacillus sp. B4I6]